MCYADFNFNYKHKYRCRMLARAAEKLAIIGFKSLQIITIYAIFLQYKKFGNAST